MPDKLCRYCHLTKPIEKFVKSPRCVDGHLHQCTACRYARDKRRYDTAKNTANLRKYRAAHLQENRTYQREYHRKWDPLNRERYAMYRQRYAARKKLDALLAFLKQKYVLPR